MIHITEAAANQMKVLCRERASGPDAGLRLWVEKGGCAGMSYEMAVGDAEPGDRVFERDGARLIVPEGSLAFLDGSTLDYEDGLTGAGFRVRNPRAARHCGCGTSFEAVPEAAAGV